MTVISSSKKITLQLSDALSRFSPSSFATNVDGGRNYSDDEHFSLSSPSLARDPSAIWRLARSWKRRRNLVCGSLPSHPSFDDRLALSWKRPCNHHGLWKKSCHLAQTASASARPSRACVCGGRRRLSAEERSR